MDRLTEDLASRGLKTRDFEMLLLIAKIKSLFVQVLGDDLGAGLMAFLFLL